MLDALNEQQKIAVEICDKNLLIIAGAGSGKTKTLTYKIAYILKNNLAKPYEILALTFTNKAANEMKERVAHIVESDTHSLYMGTFHSISLRCLRHSGVNYAIYDKHDQELLVKDILLSLNLDKNKFQPSKIASLISKYKNSNFELNFPTKEVEKIYKIYEERLKASNALDFDNIILNLIEQLKQDESLRYRYQQQFKFILIDEYQDTNNIQYEFIKLLYSGENKVFAVGDEDQSIYAFRGANINNIMSFSNDFFPCEVIKLEKNYRSTKNILSIANKIIQHNKMRMGKNLYSDFVGIDPVVKEFQTDREEALFVVQTISEILRKKSHENIAILYRNNQLSRPFEEYLTRHNINYRKIGGYKFFEKKEVKDILSYVRLAYNPKDDISFVRAVELFGGIGDKTVDLIKLHNYEKNRSLFEAAFHLTQKKFNRVITFLEFVKILQNKMKSDSISEAIRWVFDEIFAKKSFYQEDVRRDNIYELIEFAKGQNLENFMESISLYDYSQDFSDDGIAVNLLTIHSSKGLEFDTVFIIGLNEGILPSLYFDSYVEEERRLVYVGITRAKRNLFLSCFLSDIRNSYAPSRFLREIALAKNPLRRYKIGENFKHKVFGDGIVLNVKDQPLELKVNFFKSGVKVLTIDDL